MEVRWRDFGFLLDVFECCFERCFEFLLDVVIFPEQARNLCQNCEKYFTIPVCRKRKAAAHSGGGGQFLSSAVVIIVVGFQVQAGEFLRIGLCCSACGVEVS